ncbi:hypothetical protein [Microcoleus sp. A003_D6]
MDCFHVMKAVNKKLE